MDRLTTPPPLTACGRIFRNHYGEHLINFACNMDKESVLFAEIMGAILAMEHVGTPHSQTHFLVTHIYRKRTHSADKSINLDLLGTNYTWCNKILM